MENGQAQGAQAPAAHGMTTFSVIWFGQFVSTLGSGLTGFALGVWLFQTTGSATLFALNMVAYMVPNIVLSPLIGAIVDRWDRRRVMLLADTGAGLASAAVAALYLTGSLAVWHVYVATFVSAAFSAFQWPAYSAATTLLVPKRHLGRASGMTQIGEAISGLFSPALAGVLFVTIGLGNVILIDFVTFLVAIGTLISVRIPRPKRSAESAAVQGSLFREGLFGWKYIKARTGLLALLIYFASWNFFSGISSAVLMPMILSLATPDIAGYLGSAFGVGMLIGTVIMSIWGGPRRRILGILVSGLIGSIGTIVMGLTPSLALIAASGIFTMIAMPISNGSSQALWQSKVTPDVQGRVFAARRMVAWSTTPIAYLLAGPLVDHVFEPLMAEGGALAPILGPVMGVGAGRGAGLLIALTGVLVVIATGIAWLYPRLRLVEDELPDAVSEEPEPSAPAVEASALAEGAEC